MVPYTRKSFHIRYGILTIPPAVQRYHCRNRVCSRRTFSVLPPMVLRYCRFFWPCLLLVERTTGAKPVGEISGGVARRAAVVLTAIVSWVRELYQEVTDGRVGTHLNRMVKIIVHKIGRVELSNRWYRHHYPRRFSASPEQQHNLSLVNVTATP